MKHFSAKMDMTFRLYLVCGIAIGCAAKVQAELHPGVDGLLSHMENVVTSDAVILNQCQSWYNLNRLLIGSAVPDAWILRLDDLQKRGARDPHRAAAGYANVNVDEGGARK